MAGPSARKKSILMACLISLVTVLLIASLDQSDFFKTYELKSMDLFQRFHSPLENPAVLCRNQTVTACMNYVGNMVVMGSLRPYIYGGYHFAVLDTEEINAFACPGGIIFVTKA